jgi:RND family efflux transporter MFP subunit
MLAAKTSCARIAALLTLLGGCSSEVSGPAPPRPVKTIAIEFHGSEDHGTVTGEIKPRTETDVGFRIGGKVSERPVDIGSIVAREDLLARLDDTNERNSVRIAESQVAAARAEYEDAKGNETRQRELLSRGFATQATYDSAARRLKTAEANLSSAETTLNDSRERLRYTDLRADSLGVITAVGAQPGQVVSAGQMVVRLARTGEKEALFNVAEQMFRTVPHDPQVIVALLSNPDIKAEGRVREISPSADPVTRTFAVRVALHDPPEEMRLGSAVVGRVLLEAKEVAILPPTALFKDDDMPAVWVFDPATSAVSLRQVMVLRYEKERVLVSGGLKNGERVVVAGVQKLRPGQVVRLLEDSGR